MREAGQHVTVKAGISGDGIAGQREDGRVPRAFSKPKRFAGALRDALENLLHALAVELGGQVVEFTFGNSARNEYDIELGDDVPEEMLDFMAHIPQVKTRHVGIAGGGERGAECVIVAAADLVRRNRRADFDQFIARGDDGDFWRLTDGDCGVATRGSHGDFTARETSACAHDDVPRAVVAAAAVDGVASWELRGGS